MNFSPANAESRLSDVELARRLVVEIGQHCWRGKTDMIDRVFEAIVENFPKSKWTRRRVRAIWHKEAAGIDFHEMCELAETATAAHRDKKHIEGIRREHSEFVRKNARIAALLATQDEDFHRPQIEALCRGAI